MGEPFFHVGVLVDDVEAAVERYSETLGIGFAPVQDVTVPSLTDGEQTLSPFSLRLTYSTDGPPYVELLQAVGGGVYSSANGGVHHIGVWERDCEGRVRELSELGLQPEAVQYTEDGRIIVAYFEPGPLGNVRLELVDESRRPMMERWLEGGGWVD